MENTSYGINVTNRYELFSIDDDGDDPFTITQNKQRTQKKYMHVNENSSKTMLKNAKYAEKENKTMQIKITNENKYTEKSESKNFPTVNNVQRGEKPTIKETQKDNIRTIRDEGNKHGYATKHSERKTKINLVGSENREDKSRKNRDMSIDENVNRRSQNFNKRIEARGKREFDRQSGSNKTGVKPIEKRDGTGSHNWGSVKVDAKDFSNYQDDYSPQETEDDKLLVTENIKTEQTELNDSKLIIEDELKEMTLDEWKAQIAAVRSKPQYNLRKAGEGENAAQWDKMVALDKKKTETEADEENEIQKVGKYKQVLEIEFHFNDGRRGGIMGRSRGRGGKGTRNTGKRENEKKEFETREGDMEKRERRSRLPQSSDANVGNHKYTKNFRFKNTAPKVDDEHDFPSLG
ncbi:SERPINE1 mRNA-binding protein 1-like [Malaya genurostris]|uniref:SERPINE1 mRNA-binding protein 1-like n=1 Tax=Malaya genurostris TaxID=325434 RepID=UPI0026F3954E|nr:SERPINE1 mRNA-binding protein 1-like [Malaya genurostris]XP_058451905.1 SERPINE1 mRNA-binding protein 1-like [Malaya genurostris]